MASRINFTKYSLKKNKHGLTARGLFQEGASELTNFSFIKYITTLLGGNQANIKIYYKNGNIKEYSGDEDQVFLAAVKTIKEKKNKQKMVAMLDRLDDLWKNASPSMPEYFTYDKKAALHFSPSSHLVEEKDLLNTALVENKTSPTEFAKAIGTTKQNIYGQLSGVRGVTKETAIKYADELGVDPVDLLFPKKQVSIWGSVNTLEEVQLDEPYSTGRIYGSDNKETVTVPRDIYSPNIRAIKINAQGSMYHNQVAFYHYDNAFNLEINNKLAVVGAKVKGFLDEELTYYYFGLYENVRGKHFLLNPDPYVEEHNKYILKNFNLEFISPVISTLDPKAIKDATKSAKYVPQTMLVSQEAAERKLHDLTVEYEIKMHKLKDDTENDKRKFLSEGKKVLDDYINSQTELEAELDKIRKNVEKYTNQKTDPLFEIDKAFELTKEAISKKRA